MIKNIRHTGIVVEDLKDSMHFYQDMLGFKVVKEMDECGSYIDKILSLEKVKVTTVKMTTPEGQGIELLKYYSHQTKKKMKKIFEIGVSHISFSVSNLDNEYKSLKEKGINFISAPQLSPDTYAKVAFCRAPEGTLIELVEVL
jgi:catechol 2,3-dioxygenase-like lactoylglutathione lyase family enzyme